MQVRASALRSITAKFMIFTVLLTVLLLGAQGVYVVRSNNDLARSMLKARGEAMTNFMEKIGKTYISLYNIAALDTFAQQAVKDAEIAFATYYDDKRRPLTQDPERFKEPELTARLLAFEREIKGDDGQAIGHLKLYYDQSALQASLRQGYLTVATGTLITVLLFIGCIYLLARWVVTLPLSRLARTMGTVAAGDLTARADAGSRDEIGNLARDVNRMIDALAVLIGRVKVSSGRISEASDRIAETATRVALAASESASTSEQAAAAEQIVKTMERMRGQLHQGAAQSVVLVKTSEELHRTSDIDLAGAVKKLREQADEFRQIVGMFTIQSGQQTDRELEELLGSIAGEFREKLLRDLREGKLRAEDLFDENYRQVGEGKFASQASEYFRVEMLPKLAGWKNAHGSLIYVVAMDRNGFMPVHLLPARTGVIMRDPVSQQGARSDKTISQTFRRPVEAGGELVVDLATPIEVGGRHRGCLRFGYLPQAG